MNESYITVQGWVGADVEVREVGETVCASFRVGSTPRFLKGGSWVDGETSWYTVRCWRTLARNVAESVRRGEAVVVHGRVRTDVWKREDGTQSTAWLIDATFVGHDLTKGTSSFQKAPRAATTDPAQDDSMRELVHGHDAEGPRLNPSGERVDPAA